MVQRVLRILSRLDLKHDEHRRARISQGYKAKEPSHTCLRWYKYKSVAMTGLHKCVTYRYHNNKEAGVCEGLVRVGWDSGP